MTLTMAKAKAKRYSVRYGVWYVRDMGNGRFEPYAHSSEDANTVACYMGGELFKGE